MQLTRDLFAIAKFLLLSYAGNDIVHLMTHDARHHLRIDLKDSTDESYALYQNFRLGSEQELYRLHSLGMFYGTSTAGWYAMNTYVDIILCAVSGGFKGAGHKRKK